MGKNPQERENIANLFKEVYNCRSKAVHTGKLKGNTDKSIINSGAVEVAKAIEIIIDKGWPDWDKLMLGDNIP